MFWGQAVRDRKDRNQREEQRLIDRLITECTQCHCEIRLLDIYEGYGPIVCPTCERLRRADRIAA